MGNPIATQSNYQRASLADYGWTANTLPSFQGEEYRDNSAPAYQDGSLGLEANGEHVGAYLHENDWINQNGEMAEVRYTSEPHALLSLRSSLK